MPQQLKCEGNIKLNKNCQTLRFYFYFFFVNDGLTKEVKENSIDVTQVISIIGFADQNLISILIKIYY